MVSRTSLATVRLATVAGAAFRREPGRLHEQRLDDSRRPRIPPISAPSPRNAARTRAQPECTTASRMIVEVLPSRTMFSRMRWRAPDRKARRPPCRAQQVWRAAGRREHGAELPSAESRDGRAAHSICSDWRTFSAPRALPEPKRWKRPISTRPLANQSSICPL